MNISVLAAAIWSIVGLLVVSGAAALGVRTRLPQVFVYPLCAVLGGALGALALVSLLQGRAETLVLPLGLPWIGSHFRLDALAALFLANVDFGG